ncbi:MAG TPA: hypothetical protein VFW71_07995 [Actinomycetota bacterium]|nr:hypothetical protein [Actinomycetota bacterium]
MAGYTWAFDHTPTGDPGEGTPSGVTQTMQAVSAGVWYLHVRAEDTAGGWSDIATAQFDIAPAACTTCTAASVDGAGLKSFHPYQSFALGGPSTAYADLANGNLVVQTTPLSLPGMGLNLILQATYNLDRDPNTPGATDTITAGALGPGWTLAVSEGADASAGMLDAPDMADVGHALTSEATNSFDFYDASGTHQVFFQDAAGWHSPPGINLTMSSGSDGFGPFYRLVRPDGVVYEYREVQGTGFRLSSVSDLKGDDLVFSYAPAIGFPSGQLTAVSETTGGQSRTLSFFWSPTSVTRAVLTVGSQSEETDFGYDGSGRLTGTTQAAGSPDAATTGFGYTAAGLSSVTDPNGHVSTFNVSSGRLTQFSDRAAQPWGIAYGGAGCSGVAQSASATCVTQPGVATPTVYSLSAAGNMVGSQDAGDTDASGHARRNLTTYGWSANRLVTMTDAAADATAYAYNGFGQVTQAVHAGAGPTLTTTVSYQQVTPTDSTQVSWLGLIPLSESGFTVSGVSELTASTSGVGTPAPRRQSFAYNGDATLASATDPTGVTTTFSYATTTVGDPLSSVTDPDHNTTHYANYDASGQPGMITDATGTVTTLGYDFLGDLTTSTNVPLNLTTRHAYDLRRNQVSVTDPAGDTTLSCYDRNDNLTATVAPLSAPGTTCSSPLVAGTGAGSSGSVAVTVYDPRDLVSATVTNADGAIRKSVYSYFGNGQLSGIVEPRSFSPTTGAPVSAVQQVTYARYPDNRPMSMTDEVGATTAETYTPDGRIATVTEPPDSGGQRAVTSYAYNWWGEPTSTMVSGHAAPTLDSYDVFGEKTNETNPAGASVTTTYDADGRVVTQTEPVNGNTTPTATVVDTYDPAGNLKTLTQPTGSGGSTTVTYTYSPLNQLSSETDPGDALHLTSFLYDPAGRQTLRTDTYNGGPALRATGFAYDPAGRLTTETATGAGLTTVVGSFAYDADSNVISTATTDGGASAPNVSALRMAYDSAGELKAVTETDWSPTATAVTKASAYAYDQDGQATSATTDALAASHAYNLDGTEATTSAPGYGSVGSFYYPNGSLATQTMAGGVLATQAYDAAGRLASRAVTGPGGAALSSWSAIAYDGADRATAMAVSSAQPGGSSGAWTAGFGYTPAGFLSTAQGPTDAAPVAYLPDDAGNDRSTPSSTLSYSANRLTQTVSVPTGTVTTYGYDHLGEQTTQTTGSSVTTTVYDAAGHPEKVTSPDGSWVAYAYDIAGRLISRQDSASPAELDFYGGAGSQLVEATGVSGTATAAYLLDSSGSPVAQQTTANGPGTWSSFVTDPHDNDAALVDTSGHVVAAYAYDVLGNLVSQTAASGSSSTWASRLKFQMAPEDPKLGVYTLGPRLLDPTVGRFTSADNWVASEADLALQTDPLTGNRYLYAGANPAGMIDNGYGFCLLGHVHGNPNGPCVGSHEAKKAISIISASSPVQLPTSRHAVIQDLNTAFNPLGATSLAIDQGVAHDVASTFHECTIEAWVHCGIGIGNLGLQAATGGDLTEAEGAFAAVDEGEAAFAAEAQSELPSVIYREGTPRPGNLTPRAVDDGALSFRDSLSNPIGSAERPVFRPGEPYIGIDPSRLPPGSVVVDNVPPGHVSVTGVTVEEYLGALIERGRFPK